MNTKELTCAERVKDMMTSREEEIKALLNDPESDDSSDIALAIDTARVTTITLSYGGPADYLEITHNEEGIIKLVYRFSDWFDTATLEVEESSSLWEYANYMLDILEA